MNGTASAPISTHGFNRKQTTEPALLPSLSNGFTDAEAGKRAKVKKLAKFRTLKKPSEIMFWSSNQYFFSGLSEAFFGRTTSGNSYGMQVCKFFHAAIRQESPDSGYAFVCERTISIIFGAECNSPCPSPGHFSVSFCQAPGFATSSGQNG